MNKVYRVIWSAAYRSWIVANEFAKGKQKSSSKSGIRPIQLSKLTFLSKSFILLGLFSSPLIFANNAIAACSAANASTFGQYLNDQTCSDITLTGSINLSDYQNGNAYAISKNIVGGQLSSSSSTKFDFGSRNNITISGDYAINNGTSSSSSIFARGGNAQNQVTLSFDGISLATDKSSTSSNNVMFYVTDATSSINTVFNNIDNITNMTLGVLSYGTGANVGVAYLNGNSYSTSSTGNTLNKFDANYLAGYTYNQNIYSKITIGSFTNSNAEDAFYSRANKQWINGSKVDFTGHLDFYGTGDNSSYAYVFWNKTNDLQQNQLTFKNGSDVSFNLDAKTNFTSGDGSSGSHGYGYSYVFEDGAIFKLWSQQNVFGDATGNNVGIKIGSYDKNSGVFGSGAQIIVAGVNGAQLAGNGLTNIGGSNYRLSSSLYSNSIVNNGEYNADDVVFNLASGSNFNVSGIGINVAKSEYLNNNLDVLTTTKNNSGIYIRSATNITAATGMNITHNGSGEVFVKNVANINTTTAGLVLNSTSGNNMIVDLTKEPNDAQEGIINASSGNGIIIGSNSASGNVNLNITGGIFNLTGSATGLNFQNSSTINSHVITGTTINLASGSTGQAISNGDSAVTLKGVNVNVVDRTAFNEANLNNIVFAQNDDNQNNIITVTGDGLGLNLNTNLSAIKNSYLTINVTDSSGNEGTTGTGTAILIAGGLSSDVITVTDNIIIKALDATAIKINGSNARTLVNNSSITGNIVFNNGNVKNIISNNNLLDGGITAGNGNNTLNLNNNSTTTGAITLGNGNNIVNIGNSVEVASVTTGSGTNTFNLTGMESSSINSIGTLNAGSGTNNSLNFIDSILTSNNLTELKNFTNINLTSSSFSLLNKNNLASGKVNIDEASSLSFTSTYNDTVGVVLAGAGDVNFTNGANVTLINDNSSFSGLWNIASASTVTTSNNTQLGTAKAQIDGVLNVSQTSLNNALSGQGQINVNSDNVAFNFGSSVGDAFTGTVGLSDTIFTLSGDNTTALTNATLSLSSGSKTTVGASEQDIGNLTLDGGVIIFNGNNTVSTNKLSTLASSILQINKDNIPPSSVSQAGNLIDQSHGEIDQLIIAQNSDSLDVNLLTLQDTNGNVLSNSTLHSIIEDGNTVAEATYDYSLVKANGLGVSYQLIGLDLQSGKTLTLDTSSASNKTLTAQVSGVGNLMLNSDAAGIILDNSANSYTGATTVSSGKLIAGSDNAFGQTSALNISASTSADINGYKQTVGQLANSGSLALTGGVLTVTNGGSSSGTLSGSGTLNITGGDLAVTTANAGLSAVTSIGSSASVSLSGSGTLGSGDVTLLGALNLAVANTLGNNLSGSGTLNNNAAIVLTGNNSGFTGQHNIGSNGSLSVASINNLGATTATVDLQDSTSVLNFNGVSGVISNQLSGTSGTVNINNSADMSLRGNNSGFTGNYALAGDSTLTVSSTNNIGTSDVAIGAGSTLVLSDYNSTASTASELGNKLTGSGNLTLSNTQLTLSASNSKASSLSGAITLKDGSALTVSSDSQLNTAATIDIDSTTDSLNITSSGAYTLNNGLSGQGQINVSSGDAAFNFGSGAGSAFAGTVDLSDTVFTLSGDNTTALTDATLSLSSGSKTTVNGSRQAVGNLTLNGGTIIFGTGNTITTDTLATSSNNTTVQVDVMAVDSENLLDQNQGSVKTLVYATESSGVDVSKITLQDLAGDTFDSNYTIDITQGSSVVAKGSYNYSVLNDSGLKVNYGLRQLALQSGQTLTLDTSSASNKTLTAQVSGAGNLSLTSDTTGLTLTNSANSYTGATTVSSGKVIAGSDNAFGQTSALNISASTSADINGYKQTVGQLVNSGSLALTGGALTVTNGGSSSGTLSGSGTLNITGGDLAVTTANAGLSAVTSIGSSASVSLSGSGTLGSGDVTLLGALNLAVANTLGNNLSGSGTLNNNAAIVLTGNNSGFTGQHNIGSNGSLSVASINNLGATTATVDLQDSTSVLNFNGVSGVISNQLSGTSGTVNINNSADMSLRGNNSGFTGNYALAGDSTLTVSSTNNIGTSDVAIGAGSTLVLSDYNSTASTASELGNKLTGSGNLTLSNTQLTLSASNSKASSLSGAITLKDGSALTVSSDSQLNTAATIDIDSTTDSLNITSSGAYTLNNGLSGQGQINVSSGDAAFNFGSGAGSAFAGTVDLSDTVFTLSGDNTTALTDATLSLSSGSKTTVNGSRQAVGNLTLNGGTIIFGTGNTITTDTLATSSNNTTVQVDVMAVDSENLLDQNQGSVKTLVYATESSGVDVSKITLQDLAGDTFDSNYTIDITQGSSVVAKGSYNYSVLNDSGLKVNYGLRQLALQSGQTLTLDTSSASNKTLTAQVSGVGNLMLNSDAAGIILDNSANSYTGATTVSSGKLIAGSDNAFGQTSALNISASTSADINGYKQTVGQLVNSGSLALTGGALTVTNGGSSSGTLSGSGTLNITGGDLAVTTANSGLSAVTSIGSSASVSLSGSGTLGSGDVALLGALNLAVANTLGNNLSGSGMLNNNAAIVLTGNNSGFTGQHNIGSNGSLSVASINNLGATTATVDLQDSTSVLNFNGVSGVISNQLSGTSGTVNINNSADMSLRGNNSGFTGNYALAGDSTLTVSSTNNIGTSDVAIGAGSTLVLSDYNSTASTASELGNKLTGSGNLTLSNTQLTLSASNSKASSLSGAITLKDGSALTVSSDSQLNTAATIDIDSTTDSLNITSSGAYTLNNGLSGQGQINVSSGDAAFNFGSGAGSAFAGTVDLSDTVFTLSGDNTTALTDATLSLSSGSKTTVNGSRQAVGNLTLNGGTIIFGTGNTITTDTLATSSNNTTVQVDVMAVDSENLLDQNQGSVKTLVYATESSGVDVSKITLQDLAGDTFDSNYTIDITQGSSVVAKGSYNYSVLNDSGLKVNYGLRQLALQSGQTLTLDTSSASNKTLTAQVSGAGNLSLTSDTTGLTLTNSANSYTGATTVSSGKLIAGSDNAFGQTSALNISASTSADINGYKQTVGQLANSGSLALTGGVLTVTNGGSSSGTLSGSGTLNITGGDLAVTTANAGLSAVTSIGSSASVSLSGSGTLGSGDVTLLGALNLAVANTLGNNLSGSGTLNNNAAIVLTGNNSGFTGQHNIGSNGSLSVASINNLGATTATVDLQDSTSVLNFNGVSGVISNQLSGTSGTVNINNSADMSLRGNNSGFTGNYALAGDSTLTVSSTNNIGTSDVAIGAGSTLVLSDYNSTASTASELGNKLTGSGNLTLSNTQLTLSASNSKASSLSGAITLKDGSALTVSSDSQLNTAATIDIDSTTDSLNITSSGAYTLNNGLSGQGQINVSSGDAAFNFGSGAGSAFAGTVDLSDTVFTLSGNNTTALTDATLRLSSGSKTTVGTSEQDISNLTLNGGVIVFNGDGTVSTNKLATSADSIVQINKDNIPSNSASGAQNLLDQNHGETSQLITAQNSDDLDVNQITLQDTDGNELSDSTLHSVVEDGNTVAEATYDYSLVKNSGLGVSYQLTGLDLQSGQTLTLDTSSASNKTLTAQVSGVGSLSLKSDTTGLTLTNSANSYTGATTVSSGKVIAGSDNAFGQTSALNISASTSADINGYKQTVGQLANSGSLALSGGALTVTNGGSSSGTLSGSGTLNITGGDLAITTANAGLSAVTNIGSNASVSLSGNGTLGSGDVALLGQLNFNSDNDVIHNIAGSGTIISNAAMNLTGDNSSFTGQHKIKHNSTLTVSSAQNLGSDSVVVDLEDSASTLNFNGVIGNIAHTFTGAEGTVNINNNADMSLIGNNSGFTGDYALAGNSTLTVSSTDNIGTSDVAISAGSTLVLSDYNGATATELANSLTGSGNLTLSNSQLTLSASNSKASSLSGAITLKDGSALTVSRDSQLNTAATIDIDSTTDSLNISSSGAYTLNNGLSGQGQINVSSGDAAFNFGSSAGSAFAGIVDLSDTVFTLSGNNTTALTDATLSLSSGSKTAVGTSEQDISNLTLNGGVIVFNGDGTVSTNKLATSANSIVQINKDNIPSNSISQADNLLDQSLGEVSQLVTAQNSDSLNINQITLQDTNGIVISDSTLRNIVEDGNTVAEATYDYSLVKNNGLGVSYQLTGLDLQSGETLTLNTSSATNKTLTAKVSGSGSLMLNSDASGMTLDNSANSYTGATTVSSGKVIAGSDNAFGDTSTLNINSGASIDFNSKIQTIGVLANTGELELSGAELNIIHGGTSSGLLSGSGTLNITGGDLSITSANENLSATTNIETEASVSLSGAGTLGLGNVDILGQLNLNVNNAIANNLSGSGIIYSHATVNLTGDNSYFTGQHSIEHNGSLSVASINNLGATTATVDLQDSTSVLNFNGVSGVISNQLSGTSGTVNINNSADMSLRGNNSGFTGDYALAGNSTLTVSSTDNIGTSDVAISAGSTLVLSDYNGATATELANSLTGSGNLTLSNSQLTLSASNSKASSLSGAITLKDGSALTVSSDSQLNTAATIDIDSTTDSLNITSSGAYTLNNGLSGQGQINVSSGDAAFNFGSSAGSAFAGTVNLSDTVFTLSGDNTTALTDATLSLSSGSKTTVGTSEQDISNLTLNGGVIVFNGDGSVNTNKLSTSAASIVQINKNNIPPSSISQADNLLDQSHGEVNQLVTAQNSDSLNINQITLQDTHGNVLSDLTLHSIIENGNTVAEATYDYSLVKNNGLGVSYQLTGLALQSGQTLTLDTTNATNKTLTAKVSGTGSLMLNSDAAGMTLENSFNSYTGATTVSSGKVIAGSDNAFGQTATLNINSTASADLSGHEQSVGQLVNSGSLALSGGELTITNGGSSSGSLSGSGRIIVNGGHLTVSNANNNLTASTSINSGSSISLSDAGTLGFGAIDISGNLNINNSNSLANVLTGTGSVNINANTSLSANNTSFTGNINVSNIASLTINDVNQLGSALIDNDGSLLFNLAQSQKMLNSITGSGDFIKNGTGVLTIDQTEAYTGKTDVNQGGLWINQGTTLGGSNAANVTIAQGATLSGSGIISGKVINYGNINVIADSTVTRLTTTPVSFVINNDVDNYNTVNISSGNIIGNTLTINGNYTGYNNAVININTDLGDNNNSQLDHLIISGHAGGNTSIHINDIGSISGAQTTVDGIKLIDNGSSDIGAFKLDNVVTKGAYEYVLNRNNSDQNWYLTSNNDIRPDFGDYIANMDAVSKSLLPSFGSKPSGALAGGAGGLRSMDRIAKNDGEHLNSVWMINTAGRSRGEAGGGQIRYHYNEFSSVIGIDHTFYNNESALVLGAMTGTTYAKSSSENRNTSSDSSGSVNGNTFGIYASWFFDGDDPLSPFIDYYFSYGSYRNKVTSHGNDTDKYRSNLFSYTVQGGYPIPINDNWVIEPQAQISYLHYNISNHRDHAGTNIGQSLDGHFIYRIGSYFYPMQGSIKPYAGVNLWVDNTQSSVKFDGTSLSSDKARLMVEGKLGMQAQLKDNFTISGEINYRQGQHDSQNYSANIGLKYQF
ncbi:ESPR-type extended signal peptide-containing protein [Orbus wheelerorum]|uniref:ESPR-type extended signal peptide-containing protein n=1 Tax=Orbus wheelerorum TaxID=3074111 RepID=UPI00370D90D7